MEAPGQGTEMHESEAGQGSGVLGCNSSRGCNALAVYQVWGGEGSFPRESVISYGQALKKSNIGFGPGAGLIIYQ